MIIVIAKMKAKQGFEKILADGCMEMAQVVRQKEKDCLMYYPYVSMEDPSQVMIFEKYKNEKALNYHTQTLHYLDAMKNLKDILEGPVDIQKFYEEHMVITS